MLYRIWMFFRLVLPPGPKGIYRRVAKALDSALAQEYRISIAEVNLDFETHITPPL
jgi:hypothetical protein